MTITKAIRHIAVVGAGYMGGGIAQTCAANGYRVSISDVDAATAATACERIDAETTEFESTGLLPNGSAEAVLNNLMAADSIESAAAGADFIIEAVPEIQSVKDAALRADIDRQRVRCNRHQHFCHSHHIARGVSQ
ncbi:hypothetical protein BH11ACT6_BH11ACT6_17220 [soil metagenome]